MSEPTRMNGPPLSLNVSGFDHITLVVSDLDATAEFYLDILGLTETTRPGFDFPGSWYQLGNTQIHVTLEDEMAGLAGWANRNASRVSRGHHFAFQVPNFDAALATLRARNIPIADGPKVRPDGARQVYIRDPDGHLIELCT